MFVFFHSSNLGRSIPYSKEKRYISFTSYRIIMSTNLALPTLHDHIVISEDRMC